MIIIIAISFRTGNEYTIHTILSEHQSESNESELWPNDNEKWKEKRKKLNATR